MRKVISLILAITMLCVLVLPVGGLAESKNLELYGHVTAGESISITAPFGGTVSDFSIKAGDIISAGDHLFEIQTNKIYAPWDGVITGLFINPGDDSETIQSEYGALLYIKKDLQYTIEATTAEGYDKNNTPITIGEKVYLQSSASKARIGEGIIISLSQNRYTIEVLSGSLNVNERVGVYQTNEYESSSRLGYGKTAFIAPSAITASGSIYALSVKDGDSVKKGDLLFETVTGPLDNYKITANKIAAPVDGIIASIAITGANSVSKSQVMATVYPFDKLQITATINELDLPSIAIGDKVFIEMLGVSGKDMKEMLEGTISAISAVNISSEDDAIYYAYINFDDNEALKGQLREGMSANIYMADSRAVSELESEE